MNTEHLGVGLFVLGSAAIVAALLKFASGYTSEEAVPFALLLLTGAALCWSGERFYTSARKNR